MKVKLYKGPFSGKSLDTDGRDVIIMTGPKKMDRKQQLKHWHEQNDRYGYHYPVVNLMVEARYRKAVRYVQMGNELRPVPCLHPDGSVYFEYEEGSKVER